ncbi:MAG: hypothetical protein ACREEB_06100 [Caulobacteraceae bacterium]
MAHYKLTEGDENFLQVPRDATLIFAGASGTETWIERDRDMVVRIGINSVGVATADGGVLGVAIEVDGRAAKGQDGPAPMEAQLRATQGVQVLVKAGERVAFKAQPTADKALVLRTVVWAADVKYDGEPRTPDAGAPNAAQGPARR